eukprot:9079679-Pyramimonas_sp.AAC.1
MTHVLGCPSRKPKKHVKYMRFGALLGPLWGALAALLTPSGPSKTGPGAPCHRKASCGRVVGAQRHLGALLEPF